VTKRAPKPEADREIATTSDGRDITRGYTGPLLIPADRVLRTRGNGDLLIYEQVLSDPQVQSTFQQRRSAVTSCEWQVDAGGNSPLDLAAAEHVRQQLQKIGWDRVTNGMLYGVFYGYAAAEVIWEFQNGLWGWKAIKVRNRRRFRFGEHQELRLITPTNMVPGEEAPAPYFWHLATGADNDDEPYGLGLAHWCYWPALFKRNGLKFWLIFLEKFGMPTAVGKYGPNASPAERAKLLAATQAIQTDSGVVLPEGMALELLEAARSGTADYKTLHDTMDATIAKVVLGQTASSEGTPGKLGDEELQSDVRQDIIKADADLICESFNLGPVKWLTEFNFPGAKLPRVHRLTEEPEDLDKLAERDERISKLGYKPTLQHIHDTYGPHWEPDGASSASIDVDAATRDLAAGDVPAPPEAARKREDQDALAVAAVDLAAQWEALIGDRVRQIQTLLDEGTDLEQVRDRLVELAGAAPAPEFLEALARAGFASQLLARTPQA
jgi:phage gp29-like protein